MGALRNSARRALERGETDATLVPFISGIVYYLALAVVIIAVLGLFGIETTSLVAVLGSATGLVLVGDLSERFGEFGPAFALVAICPLLVVALVLAFYPESARRSLEDLNPGDRS